MEIDNLFQKKEQKDVEVKYYRKTKIIRKPLQEIFMRNLSHKISKKKLILDEDKIYEIINGAQTTYLKLKPKHKKINVYFLTNKPENVNKKLKLNIPKILSTTYYNKKLLGSLINELES